METAADGLAEFGGGVLLAIGLFGPVAAAAIISVMSVAMGIVGGGNSGDAPHGDGGFTRVRSREWKTGFCNFAPLSLAHAGRRNGPRAREPHRC